MKRIVIVSGGVALAVGAWLAIAEPDLPTRTEVLKLGEWRATVEGRRDAPAWIAPFLLGLGGGLVCGALIAGRSR